MKMPEQNTHWDRTTAIIGICIAIIALAISIYEGYSNRKHNRLSIKPKLDIQLDWGLESESGLFVYNRGLGPAQIKSFQILLSDNLLQPEEFLYHLGYAFKSAPEKFVEEHTLFSGKFLFPGNIIDKGEVVTIFGIPKGTITRNEVESFNKFFAKQVKIYITYCSFYDECELIQYPVKEKK
jgi:hypothetical protein